MHGSVASCLTRWHAVCRELHALPSINLSVLFMHVCTHAHGYIHFHRSARAHPLPSCHPSIPFRPCLPNSSPTFLCSCVLRVTRRARTLDRGRRRCQTSGVSTRRPFTTSRRRIYLPIKPTLRSRLGPRTIDFVDLVFVKHLAPSRWKLSSVRTAGNDSCTT